MAKKKADYWDQYRKTVTVEELREILSHRALIKEWIAGGSHASVLARVQERVATARYEIEVDHYTIFVGEGPFMTTAWFGCIYWSAGSGRPEVSLEAATRSL